mgnify:CR=1 FL=1
MVTPFVPFSIIPPKAIKESNETLTQRVQDLEAEVEDLKGRLAAAVQNFKDLIKALKIITENNRPPKDHERREYMSIIHDLLKQSQESLNLHSHDS